MNCALNGHVLPPVRADENPELCLRCLIGNKHVTLTDFDGGQGDWNIGP